MVPSVRIRTFLFALALVPLLTTFAAAQKLQPATRATWQGAPSARSLNLDVDVVLHVEATDASPGTTVEILPSDGIELVSGPTSWSGALAKGGTADLPITIRVVRDGDWALGARITARTGDMTEVSGAVLNVVAANGQARFGPDTPALMKMGAATSPAALAALGIGAEGSAGAAQTVRSGPLVATTVGGTVTYMAPEGQAVPVRRAYVEITETGGGAVLATAATDDAGVYSAAVNAASVQVSVYSRDFDDIRVQVFPLGQPTQRYFLRSAVTPVTTATTRIDITTAATVRGAPGAPSSDSIAARAFAVYDAMLTYWFQASALIGRNMQQAKTNFPESLAPGATCATSCYSSSSQQMFILREDAFDWDVTGHEFFHFTTNRGALRTIDSSGGGFHSGGSAIGQNDGTGHIRTRDEGMRLAWSEGLATAMALMLQQQPPSTFAFPALANMGDNAYNDTEDASTTLDAEAPARNEGFGAENSVLGLLWDLYDGVQDANGAAKDTMAGVNGTVLWGAINFLLPANPCDRVDRFWTSITRVFGITSGTTLQLAPNAMAPLTSGPADGASVPGTTAPTFQWTANGDPAAGHKNDHFYLVFSRDHFQSHLALVPVPTNGAASYKPTDAEWASVQAGGGAPGQIYEWMVVAERQDAPAVPEGWYWYSDVRKVIPRSIEATIQWSPLGADVDLHLSNPSGTDIAYYNTTTSWGFLDRDCITTCTQEILSVTSLPLAGNYRLWVHYYSDHGMGPATVRAVVRSGAQILSDTTFVLSATGTQQTLASFAIAADGQPSSVPVDAPADLSYLPKKTAPKR